MKKLFIRLFALAAAITAVGCRSEAPRQSLLVGVDANYSLEMERDGAGWKWNGRETDLFEGMAARGVGGFRVRLWTVDSGPHSRGYAARVIRRAAEAGLETYPVIFLSDDWADMLKQPLPAAWRGLSFAELVSRLAAAIDRPVVVAETAYPSTTDFTGQFSGWKHEAPGYPLTPEGQRRWLADFLSFCASHPAIQAVYYWSPEWFGEGMWEAFALFDPEGEARPAWDAIPGFSR